MLIIRSEQMAALSVAMADRFEQSLVEHVRCFAPRQAQALGEDGLRQAVQLGAERAAGAGFDHRDSLRLYVELMFLFGCGFATDPQYPWAAAALETEGTTNDQQSRADILRASAIEYTHAALGAGREYVFAGLTRLADQRLSDFTGRFPESLLRQLRTSFPEKCSYLGEERLTKVIQSAERLSDLNGVDTEAGVALFALLTFLLGHEVDRDPTIPWVEATLKETVLADPAERIRKLEVRTWEDLNSVLAANGRRAALAAG